MQFKVFINDKLAGTFGHTSVENLSISVTGDESAIYLFAGAICSEGAANWHYSWPQLELAHDDVVRIVRSEGQPVSPVERKYEMGRTQRKARESDLCEFCQRNETQVPKLIAGDENRPGICSDCVGLCVDILKSDA